MQKSVTHDDGSASLDWQALGIINLIICRTCSDLQAPIFCKHTHYSCLLHHSSVDASRKH